MKHANLRRSLLSLSLGFVLMLGSVPAARALGSPDANQSGSTGLQATITSPPPKTAPTISLPVNGRVFTSTPVSVSGLCTSGLLLKVFSNNIFVGSVQCQGGSFSLKIDLFSGQNDLLARQYDALDQASPDSNTVHVTYKDGQFAAFGERVSMTSKYAKLGADTGTRLSWPIILSGGTGPYAIQVDWGDGSATDLMSEPFAGSFNITHVYQSAGVYRVVARASDTNGQTAFLQLVGVGNGKVTQANSGTGAGSNGGTTVQNKLVWWPLVLIFPFIGLAFWLGRRSELQAIHHQLELQSDLYNRDLER